MPLNDQDARALTYLACRIRKETHGANVWDEAGTYAEIATLVGQNLPANVERITRHAADVEAKTPGAIRRPFVPDAPKAAVRFPAKSGEDCRTHPGEWADGCRSCAADRLTGEATTNSRPASPDVAAQAIARARAALRGEIQEPKESER